MFEDMDYKILKCDGKEGNWFDFIAYIWFVALPQFVIVATSDYGILRGDLSEDVGSYCLFLIPLAYIIEPTFSTKYVGRRIVSAIIWFMALAVIWAKLPLWFYAIYLCVPIAWFIKHKKEKKK